MDNSRYALWNFLHPEVVCIDRMYSNANLGYPILNDNQYNAKFMSTKQSLGKLGEALAANFLEQKGYIIIATNWHCRYGEVDIVACLNNVWAFVEVKTRQGDKTEDAFTVITSKKQQKIIKTVQSFCAEHNLDDIDWRIDAIAVVFPHNGQPIIEHVEDAFDW